MRYPAIEKLEIIRLVEQSHLPVRRTLANIGIPPTTFYRWYDRFVELGPATNRGSVAGRPLPDGKKPAHSRSNTSQSISAASFTNSCRGSIKSIKRGRRRSSCSSGRGRCFMGRTEIAGFQPQTYKTLQSDARKTTNSQLKINDMGFVQGELGMGTIG